MTHMIHFEILGKDPEKTAAFYKKALGRKVKPWDGVEQNYWMVELPGPR